MSSYLLPEDYNACVSSKNLQSNISCFYLNYRSLLPKLDVIQNLFKSLNPCVIITFSETWLSDMEANHLNSLMQGYKFSHDARQASRFGDFAAYINESFTVSILNISQYQSFEHLSLKIYTGATDLIVSLISPT